LHLLLLRRLFFRFQIHLKNGANGTVECRQTYPLCHASLPTNGEIMKTAFIVLTALFLTGCDNGRYQIAGAGTMSGVYRVDTRTGELTICGVNLGRTDNKIGCVTGF